jgi:hypothetical protein
MTMFAYACPYSGIIWFVDIFKKLMLKVYEPEILGDKVEKVQVSDCIVDSPCVLVMGE